MNIESLECKISYDGPDLKDNTIDVNHLAPALLAFGESLTKISKQINPDTNAVCNVKIKTFRDGCFISDLIVQTIISDPDGVIGAIGTGIAAGMATSTQQLFNIFVEVFKAKLFAKNEEPKVEININAPVNGDVTLITGNGNKMTMSNTAYAVYAGGSIDKEMKHIVNPLTPEHIDTLEVEGGVGEKKTGFKVSPEEKEYFYGSNEITTMFVRKSGYIENMHKRYRTFGLVDSNGRQKIACYIPPDVNINSITTLFDSNAVEIEGEAEIDENNVIQKIKVSSGRKIQLPLFEGQVDPVPEKKTIKRKKRK